MKTFILFLLNICITTIAVSQKIFQGEITYRLHASYEENNDLELKVSFASNRILLRLKEKNSSRQEESVIVLLDSGKIFTVYAGSKTYKEKRLIARPEQIINLEKKIIHGFSTTPIQQFSKGLNITDFMFKAISNVFYVADSLYFPIPDIYDGNPELMMINKNKIILGALIKLADDDTYKEGDYNNKTPKEITAEAIDIKPMIINESEFAIPANYVNSKTIKYDDYNDGEKTEILTDSTAVEIKEESIKKKPVKSNKTKKPVKKSAAIKRKN